MGTMPSRLHFDIIDVTTAIQNFGRRDVFTENPGSEPNTSATMTLDEQASKALIDSSFSHHLSRAPNQDFGNNYFSAYPQLRQDKRTAQGTNLSSPKFRFIVARHFTVVTRTGCRLHNLLTLKHLL